VTITQKILISY